MGRNFN